MLFLHVILALKQDRVFKKVQVSRTKIFCCFKINLVTHRSRVAICISLGLSFPSRKDFLFKIKCPEEKSGEVMKKVE